MTGEWRAFLSAVQFLTRLPVPDPGWEDGRLDRAAKWFPLVGTLIGTICAGVFSLAALIWTADIAVVLAILAGVLITGALHEDGLADTADGLGGGRDRTHRLAIMKDSQIGTYGALALIFLIVLKLFVLVPFSGTPQPALAALFIAAHTLSRAAMTGIVWTLPYAREADDAKVAPLSQSTRALDWTVLLSVTAPSLVLLVALIGVSAGIAAGIGAVLAFALCRVILSRALGGWTGDTTGATQQVSDIFIILGVAALWT